nr:hypothetical protein [Mesorhizobium sp.]
MLAQGWNIIGGYADCAPFGNSVFYGLGSCGVAIAMVQWEMPFAVGLIFGMAMAGPSPYIVNPYAMIESTRMLLEWLGHNRGAHRIIDHGKSDRSRARAARTRTGDIRGTTNTEGMTSAIVAAIEKEAENVLA